MRTQVLTKNKEDRKQLLNLLFALGYKWHDQFTDVDYIEREWPFSNYDIVLFNNDNGYVAGNKTDYSTPDYTYSDDIGEVMKIASKIAKKIVINNVRDYEAIVKEDGIYVGCQTISFEKFEEIVKAIEKIQSK